MAGKIAEDTRDNMAKCEVIGSNLIDFEVGDIIHYKLGFGQKFEYLSKNYISLKNEDIIAIERNNCLIALGSMVICKLVYKEKIGKIIIPQGSQQNEGDYYGEVISTGKYFMDKSLKVNDKIAYQRNEGYRFMPYDVNNRNEYLSIKERWICGKYEETVSL